MFRLPAILRKLYILYIRYIKRDEIYAGLLDGWHEKRVTEFWPLAAQREGYKNQWFEYWQQEDLDFILTVPNALPAVPHGGTKNSFGACGYTFLFNVVSRSFEFKFVRMTDLSLARLLCRSSSHHPRRPH